jgi:signal peptidase I
VSVAARPSRRLRDLAEALLVSVLLGLFARTYLLQPFRIPSASMAPTLEVGDHLLVNRFVYGPTRWAWERRWLPVREPRRGDVIVFRYPGDPRRPFVKRALGLPGDVVELRARALSVGGVAVDESAYARHADSAIYPPSVLLDPYYRRRDTFGPARVPQASLFVLGDNRELSADSRSWGFLPRPYLLGRALAVYGWPVAGAEGVTRRPAFRVVR